ncbi:MAG: hypothetical protein R2800_09845 [Flavipsychrobacter sp.]
MLINGMEYDWSTVNVMLLNRIVEGISAVDYDDNVDKVTHKGRGKFGVSRGRGNYEASGSITLSMKEVVAIQRALPKGRRMQDIAPFPIIISYLPDDGSNVIVTDRMNDCEFTNVSRKTKVGDTQFESEFVLEVGSIDWDI